MACLLALTACVGDDGDTASESTPDATATRAAELADLATIKADRTATEVSQSVASPSPVTSTVLADVINTSTPEPTATTEPTSTPFAEAKPTATSRPEPTEPPEIDLAAKLPMLNDLPSGFSISEDREFTSADLAAGYDDSAAHLDRLQQWGFKSAYKRQFEIPSLGLKDWLKRTIFYDCVVAQYGSAEQVQEASQFAGEAIKSLEGADVQEVSTQQVGDWTLALQGSLESNGQTSIWAFIFAQVGDMQYQCRGASGGHNPLEEMTDLVELIVSR